MNNYEVSDYAISLQGTSHIKDNSVCQDYSRTMKVNASHNKRYVLASVADGCGSCSKADQGSKMAVTVVLESIANYLQNSKNFDGTFSLEIIQRAFTYALGKINKEAKKQRANPNDFETTLTVAIYDVDTHDIYFGHAGDGGLVAVDIFGNLLNLTRRCKVKGEALNYVRALADTNYWTFGTQRNIASFALMTDGVYDKVSPVYREYQNYQYRNYIPFFQSLLYKSSFSPEETAFIRQQMIDSVLNNASFRKNVSDDISLVCY